MATGDLVFAFLLGVGTFFSPCAVALVPSYLAYFAGRTRQATSLGRAAWDGLRVGAAASAGVAATFAVLATLLYLVRRQVHIDAVTLTGTFAWLGIATGLAFAVLGVLLVLGRSPGVTLRLRAPEGRSPRAMAIWGVLFAAGSMGCSLPLTLALLARVLSSPSQAPFLVATYAAGLAGVLLVLSPILGVLERRAAAWLARGARVIQIASGVALAVAGVYVVVYYVLVL